MQHKIPEDLDTRKITVIILKFDSYVICYRVMCPKDADIMANSVEPDLTAVWSGSTLFAQAYLFENLGSLQSYAKV